ncbi:mixed lineage kinase domain-like protein [Poecilia latipinna]|uniref:Mixed lineage kinase domain-like protein n=1 Tax=Poecilia formosa TaxID=48698 RepID=A0A087YIV5_POEFO|nr:PREDICTED: mixed lineage kinase domain-like protein [Poecilia formosa]XP_014903967.1 PREDICTED: mixed lineage kinase domain-like protein [Poecilia latipinna]
MDIVNPLKSVLSTAVGIYKLVEKAKANKKQCHRVGERVKALERVINTIDSTEASQLAPEVTKTLEELSTILNSAFGLIEKFTLSNWMKRLYKTSSDAGDFQMVNDRLSDSFQNLTIALQLKQGSEMAELLKGAFIRDEDEKDRKEDEKELNRMLMEYMEYVETMRADLEDVKNNVTQVVETLKKPKIITMDIRVIKQDELWMPKLDELNNLTDQSPQVYRGTFKDFTVAAKIFTNLNTTAKDIKSEFKKEVETMKRFESPNILRVFGICILDENTPNTKYLIIMEYCEKGSLRDVLSSERDLSWTRKVSMCRDAAQGLYRLHQTEQKSKLHTDITSKKFFVDENYRVKLGGLELAQTETSLRNATVNKRKDKDISSLCYSSPQMLTMGMKHYCRKCEIYSLGIVMWEIAAQRKPFSDSRGNKDTLHVKVVEKRDQEPVPCQCPGSLKELINECRGYECIQRPSAGVLVDKLRCLLVQLEQQ